MRRFALLLLACALPAAAQTTTTYTGTIKDLTGAVVTSGRITFTLKPSGMSNISGAGSFVSSTVSCLINGTGNPVSASDGVSPCVVTNNTSLSPTGTYYNLCIQPYNSAPGSCINAFATGGSVDLSTLVPTPATQPSYGVASTALANTWNLLQTFGSGFTSNANSTINGTLSVSGGISGNLPISGAATAQSYNKVVEVDQLAGATADVQLNACFTALPSGGICDARGYGATTQHIANTVSNPSGVPITILFDPATKFQPNSASVQMFHLNRGARVGGLHIDIAGSGYEASYTGTAILIDDNIRDADNFWLVSTYVDNVGTELQPASGSVGLKFNATDPNAHSQVFAHVVGYDCRFMDKCIVLTSSGGGFINADKFSDLHVEGCTVCISVAAGTSPSSAIEGNSFIGVTGQASTWTTSFLTTTGPFGFNSILGVNFWDNPGTWDVSMDSGSAHNYIQGYTPKGINDQTTGAEQNTYNVIRGSQATGAKLLSLIITGLLQSPYHVITSNAPPTTFNQTGLWLVNNFSGGSAETDFVNDKGPGTGGFYFYNVANNASSLGTALASIDPSGNVTAQGKIGGASLQVGTGTTVTLLQTLSTSSVTPTAVTANSCSDQNFTLTGATGSTSYWTVKAPGSLGNLSVMALDNGANSVTLHFCNPSGISVTPPAGVYTVSGIN